MNTQSVGEQSVQSEWGWERATRYEIGHWVGHAVYLRRAVGVTDEAYEKAVRGAKLHWSGGGLTDGIEPPEQRTALEKRVEELMIYAGKMAMRADDHKRKLLARTGMGFLAGVLAGFLAAAIFWAAPDGQFLP